MYLKNIAIKNVGPIDEISVYLPFKENGNPKPIIFAGENGSGKTVLLSQIVDELYEIGSQLFTDINQLEGMSHRYYKISGGTNLRAGKGKCFSLLQFIDSQRNKIEYFDKTGTVTKDDFTKYIQDFSLSPNKENDNQKSTTQFNAVPQKKNLQDEWEQGTYFYQPAYRYEKPFWINDPFVDHKRFEFEDNIKFSEKLNKEIEIVSSARHNKSFLMDLVLDYLNNRTDTDKTTWENINNILRQVKQKNNISFGIGPRGGYRVSIIETIEKQTKILLPSIDNLSLGESVLLNLFVNIIRYGDKPPKLADQIQGIVIIDEIDLHLHTDLQNKVLPKLIKMFPKIQFIITTHSPLFLLGMRDIFGENEFEIINMPNGEIITTERFSEFENAYHVLEETEKFENEVKKKILEKSKPVVYVEGPTDVKYIKKAYELYKKESVLEKFGIEIIGEETKTGTKNSNNKALKNAENFLRTNLNLLKQKIVLLNDPEEQVDDGQYGDLLYIRKIPKFDENLLQHGIENLFNEKIINKMKEQKVSCFEYHVIGAEKKNFKIVNGKKMTVCNWICENGTEDDFKNFEKIFDILERAIVLS